jgi:hypothetical protein
MPHRNLQARTKVVLEVRRRIMCFKQISRRKQCKLLLREGLNLSRPKIVASYVKTPTVEANDHASVGIAYAAMQKNMVAILEHPPLPQPYGGSI